MKYLPLILFLILSFAPMAVLADTADPQSSAYRRERYVRQQFVPLTNIPGLTDLTTAPDLPKFLNTLYKLCIGVGAAIAVLQIMRAGIMYMGRGQRDREEAGTQPHRALHRRAAAHSHAPTSSSVSLIPRYWT